MNPHRQEGEESAGPSIFGFQIRSSLPLKFLRSGRSRGILNIRTQTDSSLPPAGPPLLAWKLQGAARDVSAELYAMDDRYGYRISDAGWYEIDTTEGIIRIPEGGDEIVREQRLWGMPTLLCSMRRDDFFLHAAAAEINGGAVLFAAPGRHGKTTLAMAFHREGYRVLSEDSACCRLTPFPSLLPGPAILRIRPDVFDGHPPAGTHVIAVYEDRIYLAMDEIRRGIDDPVPLKGIVFLRESVNEIHLERVLAQRAIPDLWALSFRLPNDASRAQSFRQLTGLVGRVPVWNLYRPLRFGSLAKTVATLVKAFASAS